MVEYSGGRTTLEYLVTLLIIILLLLSTIACRLCTRFSPNGCKHKRSRAKICGGWLAGSRGSMVHAGIKNETMATFTVCREHLALFTLPEK